MNDPQDSTPTSSAPSTTAKADDPITALDRLCARLRGYHLNPDDRRELACLYPRHLHHLDRFIAFSELYAQYAFDPLFLELAERIWLDRLGYPALEADPEADAKRGFSFKPLPYGPAPATGRGSADHDS